MSGHESPADTGADSDAGADVGKQALQRIKDALRGLQFGSVTIIVQDGLVVQLERTEKHRFGKGRKG